LHASSLLGEKAPLLIAGTSGAGKSTLAWAGISAGYLYAGDETCVSDGTRLWGVPRAIMYDPTEPGRTLPPWIVGADCESYRYRSLEGGLACVPLRRPPPERVATGAFLARDTHVILAERAEEDSLAPAPPLLALERLYADRSGDMSFPIAELVHASRCWRLRWSNPRIAFQLIAAQITPPARPPLEASWARGPGHRDP
jgi:hypothetical protein